MKAMWNDMAIAQSDDMIVVEGNHYFLPKSIGRHGKEERRPVLSQISRTRDRQPASYPLADSACAPPS